MTNLHYLPLVTIVNLEFGWVKYWQMTLGSPNSPNFFPAKDLRYTVQYIETTDILINVAMSVFSAKFVVIISVRTWTIDIHCYTK